jgi:hypothetical protein
LRNIKLSTRNEGKTRGSEGDITQAVVARYAIARNESKVHHPDLHLEYQESQIVTAIIIINLPNAPAARCSEQKTEGKKRTRKRRKRIEYRGYRNVNAMPKKKNATKRRTISLIFCLRIPNPHHHHSNPNSPVLSYAPSISPPP